MIAPPWVCWTLCRRKSFGFLIFPISSRFWSQFTWPKTECNTKPEAKRMQVWRIEDYLTERYRSKALALETSLKSVIVPDVGIRSIVAARGFARFWMGKRLQPEEPFVRFWRVLSSEVRGRNVLLRFDAWTARTARYLQLEGVKNTIIPSTKLAAKKKWVFSENMCSGHWK